MSINSKQKGNKFERDIANLLSTRFEAHTGKPQSFRRNVDSGSFWGGKNIVRKETHDTDYAIYGDLVCPREFNFSIECKNYKEPPSFNSILKQSVTLWDEWLGQAMQDSSACGKDYMIIVKYNRCEIMCMVDRKFYPVTCNFTSVCYNSSVIVMLSDILKLDDSFYFS